MKGSLVITLVANYEICGICCWFFLALRLDYLMDFFLKYLTASEIRLSLSLSLKEIEKNIETILLGRKKKNHQSITESGLGKCPQVVWRMHLSSLDSPDH